MKFVRFSLIIKGKIKKRVSKASTCPSAFKLALVAPVHKSEPASDPKNPGEGDSRMKQTGMLVVSLRILVSPRVFQAKRQSFKPPRSRFGFREETQNNAKKNKSQIFFLTLFVMSLYH